MKIRLALLLILLNVYTVFAQTPPPEEVPPDPEYTFAAGEQVIVRTPPGDNLRLRSHPDAKSALILNMSNGLVVTVVDGPVSVMVLDDKGYTLAYERWWEVELSGGTTGWALGSRNRVNFLMPLPQSTAEITCEDAPEPRLEIGEQGRVASDAVAVLYTSPQAMEVVTELAGRELFEVLDGPECGVSSNYMWKVQNGDEIGWMTETDYFTEYRYITEPMDAVADDEETTECPGGLTQQLEVGGQAKVIADLDEPLNVRSRPTINGIDLYLLYSDEIVTVTEGPLCYPINGDNQSWWRVENPRGVEGWIAEGDADGYWLLFYDEGMATPTPTLDAACILTTLSGVNLRSGAGAEFERVGSAGAGVPLGADGQALASDGTLWWRLADGQGWVAASLVSAGEGCERLTSAPASTPKAATPNATSTVSATATAGPALSPTVNPNAACLVTTLQGVNFRAAPNTEAERIGSALADTVLEADGQFKGADGFTWWRLVDGQGWVREDLVAESAGCSALPDAPA